MVLFSQVEDIVKEDANGLLVNITDLYGGFQQFTFEKMSGLANVDISGCKALNASEFTEVLIKCLKIEKVEMVGCTQFSEHQIVDICTSLPKLVHFDSRKCTGLQYANANVILCNVRTLRVFKVEIKYPQYEKKDWRKLKSTFSHIDFGEEVEKFLADK